MKAPEGFEEGVRQAIRPRTLRFPALGRGQSARWLRPVAAMAALFLVMFGALLVLQPTDPERFQMANVFEDETPDLKVEQGVFSPIPSESEEAGSFSVSEEERASEPAREKKRDMQTRDADDSRESFEIERLNRPEADEVDADLFRAQSKAMANKKEVELDHMQALGYLDATETGGLEADNHLISDTAVRALVPVLAPTQESLSFRPDTHALSEGHSGPASADIVQANTMSETSRAWDQVLGQPKDFEAEVPGTELRKAADAERARRLVGGTMEAGERIAFERFEDRVERTLNEATPTKTVRVRSYNVGGDGVWVEEGYNGEVTRLLKRGSPELEALVVLDPELRTLVKGTARAIFQVEGKWYTLEESQEEN